MSQAQWIDSPGRLQEWVDRHAATAHAVGMDTEFVRESTYFPKLALIQVAVATEVALIDPLAFAPAAIAGWLGQATGAVLMHSASEDIEALRMLLPEGPPRLFDTQIAAAFAGLGADQDLLPKITVLNSKAGRRLFPQAAFPDWASVIHHWHERIHAIARELKAGDAGVRFEDEQSLRYCDVLPLLRLAERKMQLENAALPEN